MNDLTLKLKELLINKLRKNEQIIDDPYLNKCGINYSRRMLAQEIEDESEVGLDVLNSILLLSIDILSRQQ
jgi:hypothetical protein